MDNQLSGADLIGNGRYWELSYLNSRLNGLREPLLQKILADVTNPNALTEKEQGYLEAIADVIALVESRMSQELAEGAESDAD